MNHDLLADVFSIIKNTEDIGRKECTVPVSNLSEEILKVLKAHDYIKDYEMTGEGMRKKFKVSLHGRVNNCNVIKPRFSVKTNDFIKWEKRFLPSYDIGLLLLTTSKGVMDHKKAKEEKIGGQLLGYVY